MTTDPAALEACVMICPQCDGEGGYPDGLDEAACHTECTRCKSNGWIVDVSALSRTGQLVPREEGAVEATDEDRALAALIRQEGGQIAHDMAHHVGDQVFEVLKRNGLAMHSEAGGTAMLVMAANMMLEQAIDQCSRAAEEDCRMPVVVLFRDLLAPETRAALASLKPETDHAE